MTNLNCGLSGLPIEEGDNVVLFPLKDYRFRKDIIETPLVTPMEDYVPFCLPIEGEFSYSNGLENIVKNKNTEIIEKTHKTNIDSFVSIVFCSRLVTDSYSALFNEFATPHAKNILDRFYKNKRQELFDFGFNIDVHDGDEKFTHNEVENIIFYISNDDNVVTAKKDTEIIFSCNLNLISVLDNLYKNLNINLVINNKDNDNFETLSKLTGMFVLKEVYDKFVVDRTKHLEFFNKEWEVLKTRQEEMVKIKKHLEEKIKEAHKKIEDIEKNNKYLELLLYSPIETSNLMNEFKMFDLRMYYDYMKDDSLKEDFRKLLNIISLMYNVNKTFYPNNLFKNINEELIEFESFRLNWLKEKLKEYEE